MNLFKKNGSDNRRIPLVRETARRINLRYLRAIENNRNYILGEKYFSRRRRFPIENIFLLMDRVIFLSGVRTSPRIFTIAKYFAVPRLGKRKTHKSMEGNVIIERLRSYIKLRESSGKISPSRYHRDVKTKVHESCVIA